MDRALGYKAGWVEMASRCRSKMGGVGLRLQSREDGTALRLQNRMDGEGLR